MPGAGVIWKRLTYRCDPKSGLSWDCQPKTLTVCWGAWTCNVVGSEKEHAGMDCLENEIQGGKLQTVYHLAWEGTSHHFCCTALFEAATNPPISKGRGQFKNCPSTYLIGLYN